MSLDVKLLPGFFQAPKMLSNGGFGVSRGQDCLGKVISPSKIGGPNIQTQKNISNTQTKTINAKNWRPSKTKTQIVEPTASKPFLWPPPFLPHEVGWFIAATVSHVTYFFPLQVGLAPINGKRNHSGTQKSSDQNPCVTFHGKSWLLK